MRCERIPEYCDICGEDNTASPIKYRVIDETGAVLYVCVYCAADSFNIEDAKIAISQERW